MSLGLASNANGNCASEGPFEWYMREFNKRLQVNQDDYRRELKCELVKFCCALHFAHCAHRLHKMSKSTSPRAARKLVTSNAPTNYAVGRESSALPFLVFAHAVNSLRRALGDRLAGIYRWWPTVH